MKIRMNLVSITRHLCAYIGAFIIVFPILHILNVSLRRPVETLQPTLLLLPPRELYFAGYIKILTEKPYESFFLRSLFNSFLVSAFTMVLAVLCGFLAAYGFVRYKYRFSSVLSIIILAFYMVPSISIIAPLYTMLRSIGVQNRLEGVIIASTAIYAPLVTWIMAAFLSTLPKEYEEAALLDGASRLTILFRIVLPICRSGIISSAVYTFIATWNDVLIPLMLISTPNNYTSPLMLLMLIGEYTLDWTTMCAATVIMIIPAIIIVIIAEKYLTTGFTLGIKG